MGKNMMEVRYDGQYCKEMAKRIYLDTLEECFYYPRYFTIETCNNCNAQCIMCPKGQKGIKNIQVMEDMLFNKILNEISQYSSWIMMICLNSDGEPLLDKGISTKIKKLKNIGIKHVNISTNASLLTPQKIEELLESGLDDIRISLDGYEKKTYEKIRRGLKYDVVKENVLNLIKMRDAAQSKMEIRIRMVELDENLQERKEWMEYWKSKLRKSDKVQIMPMHTWSQKIANEEQGQIEFYSNKPCVSVFSSFTINYDGKVQLCDSDIEQQYIMGDIKENSIKDIWQGEKFEMIRKYHANGQRNHIKICRGCDHWSRYFNEETGDEECSL